MKMLFYPDLPRSINKIVDICKRLDISISNDPRLPYDIAIHWDYRTICPMNFPLTNDCPANFINGKITDLCKSHVDNVFFSIFGYSSFMEVLSDFGSCMRKSEYQAKHDSQIVNFPLEPRLGFVYQKILDSRVSFDLCADIRLPVFKNTIPFAFIKYRPVLSPIKTLSSVSLEKNLKKLFSRDELNSILLFNRMFGLDFGEIDIIRNNSDGKIYILDVNNMAGNGLYKHLSPSDLEFVQSNYAYLFKQNFLP